jgi:replication fork clamp-binding protein CrfC
MNYCKDPKTVILAVIPGNQDMSTSESLQLAMNLDPEGRRTLGVITKIDIMDKGTDASSMLTNEEIPLRLGYVGVKGRSQHDIKNKVKVRDALKEEAKYFSEHPIYSSLPADVVGTTSLVDKLTKVLYTLIRDGMPQLRKVYRISQRKLPREEKNVEEG